MHSTAVVQGVSYQINAGLGVIDAGGKSPLMSLLIESISDVVKYSCDETSL